MQVWVSHGCTSQGTARQLQFVGRSSAPPDQGGCAASKEVKDNEAEKRRVIAKWGLNIVSIYKFTKLLLYLYLGCIYDKNLRYNIFSMSSLPLVGDN